MVTGIPSVSSGKTNRLKKRIIASRVSIAKLTKTLHTTATGRKRGYEPIFFEKLELKESAILSTIDHISDKFLGLLEAQLNGNRRREKSLAKNIIKYSKRLRRLVLETTMLRPEGSYSEVMVSKLLFEITGKINLKINGLYAFIHAIMTDKKDEDMIIEIDGELVKIFESLIYDEKRVIIGVEAAEVQLLSAAK
ncbi:hypothetical protein HOC01_02400 [archaeon]|jgi:hypothetical protein|nr:hypothetical protein [archaeon]MBT6697831.1 hypothetical protein [archaeon]